MSKFLILGSAGQIGSNLKEYLRERGETVFEHDVKYSYKDDLRLIDDYVGATITFVNRLFESDFVFFLAWDVGGAKYLEKYEKTFDFLNNNIMIMERVFKVINAMKKPFVFASSQMVDMPHTVYGNTKLIGEQYTKALNGIVARMWNVYGLEIPGEKSHVITDLIVQAQEKNKIELLTTGEEYRQFLYSRDCCEALYMLSQKYGEIPRDKNIHITSFQWTQIVEIADIIAKKMKCSWKSGEKVDRVQNLIKIEPDPYILKYWKPKTSIEEGIECIINKMIK